MTDWQKHDGGPCPVDGDVRVDVRHADGTCTSGILAHEAIDDDPNGGFDWWQHYDCMKGQEYGYIIAYRIVKED